MKIADITLGENVRRGERTARPSLVKSFEDVGQLQPVGVTPDGVLVFGFGRLLAAQELGWTDIKTVECDANGSRIAIQVAENQQRDGLTVWELAQAALDLKLEGQKQGEVAQSLLIGTKDVSRLQKIAREVGKDTEVDDEVLNLFDADELEQLASGPSHGDEVAPSDVLRLYMEQDTDTYRGRDIRRAQQDAQVEVKAAAWLDEIADTLSMLAEKGVVVVSQDPRFFTDRGGNKRVAKGTAEIGKEPKTPGYQAPNYINVPLDTHVLEECHRVYVTEVTTTYTEPVLVHCCVDTTRHTKEGDGATARKGGTDMAVMSTSEKEKASAQRRVEKLATQKRFDQAGIWLGQSKVADINTMAYELAISTLRSDDYRQFNRIIGVASERPKGADFGWHETRFNVWLEDAAAGNEVIAQRLLVQLLTIKDWCVGSAFARDSNPRVPEWAAIEVPDAE